MKDIGIAMAGAAAGSGALTWIRTRNPSSPGRTVNSRGMGTQLAGEGGSASRAIPRTSLSFMSLLTLAATASSRLRSGGSAFPGKSNRVCSGRL